MPDKSSLSFPGFNKPEANFFRLPNEWIDITARLKSLAEIKVVEYVLRHTWGFSEYDVVKKITTDEFMHGRKRVDHARLDSGTGLSKQAVIDGLAAAVAHGLLLVEVDESDRARIKKYYKLRMKSPVNDARVNRVDPDVKSLDIGVKSSDSNGQQSRHRSEKDTLERYNNVNKEIKNEISREEMEYYANLLAKKLGDQKSVSYYRILCRKFKPEMLLEKAAAIVADGGARNPGAVFVQWIKTL